MTASPTSAGALAPGSATPSPLAELRDKFLAWPAFCVYAIALVVRLALLGLFSTSPHFGVQSGDMRFYHDWALRIAGGQWTDHHAFYGLPGYAYLLAGVYSLAGLHPAVMLVLQAGVDAATASLIFLMARAVIPAHGRASWHVPAAALFASLCWIFYVPAQTFSVVLMPTVLATACYWFCVHRAILWREVQPVAKWLGIGLLIGGVAMMVATVLFALPLLITSALRAVASWRSKAAAICLLFTGLLLGTSPAWLHNRLVAHEPVFLSAHGGINFWIGNAPGANGYPKIPGGLRAGQQELLWDSVTLAEKATGRAMTRAEVSQYWSAKAKAHIAADRAAWLRLMGVKVKNFWNAFSYDDVTIIPLLREEGVLFPGMGFGVAAWLGLTGIGLALVTATRGGRVGGDTEESHGKETASPLWLVAAVLLHMVALLPVFITERYRLAAVPGLLVLGAFALALVADFLRERRWIMIGVSGVLCVGTGIIVHLPAPHELLTVMEPYNLAISEMEVGQLDRAEKHLAMVSALNAGDPAVLFAQGNLWMKRGQPERAKGYYRQTLEKDPRNADAFTNLGVIAYGEQRWELAIRFFHAALALQPGDGETQRWLAMAKSKL